IKHNVLLNCLRLFFIMGRKGGFSSLGGGQTIAHGSFPSTAVLLKALSAKRKTGMVGKEQLPACFRRSKWGAPRQRE
ncbi:hypothetical protein P9853_01265, partial [Geobacillus stearothermophilus]|uniref:hypothetical protein n=1 Tax=Geobacillus stearothermophilus TaxID=1422 RepID=UPI002E1D4DB7|nr:hypothetical protein [Geobacillus stearothermophilus]MED5043704.1 hypothetical protein [Geobacillus stearothermophilus]